MVFAIVGPHAHGYPNRSRGIALYLIVIRISMEAVAVFFDMLHELRRLNGHG